MKMLITRQGIENTRIDETATDSQELSHDRRARQRVLCLVVRAGRKTWSTGSVGFINVFFQA